MAGVLPPIYSLLNPEMAREAATVARSAAEAARDATKQARDAAERMRGEMELARQELSRLTAAADGLAQKEKR